MPATSFKEIDHPRDIVGRFAHKPGSGSSGVTIKEYDLDNDAHVTALFTYISDNATKTAFRSDIDSYHIEEFANNLVSLTVEDILLARKKRQGAKFTRAQVAVIMRGFASRMKASFISKGTYECDRTEVYSLTGPDMQAIKVLARERAALEEKLGRSLSASENAALANHIRDNWATYTPQVIEDGKTLRLPRKDYAHIRTMVSIEQKVAPSESDSGGKTYMDHVSYTHDYESELDRDDSDFDDGAFDSKDLAIKAMFDKHIPGAVSPVLKPREATLIRQTVAQSGKSIAQLCKDWENCEGNEAIDALFAPFPHAESDREREKVVNFLLEKPHLTEEWWLLAVKAATAKTSRR